MKIHLFILTTKSKQILKQGHNDTVQNGLYQILILILKFLIQDNEQLDSEIDTSARLVSMP